jgi:hypothetical protein
VHGNVINDVQTVFVVGQQDMLVEARTGHAHSSPDKQAVAFD